MVLAMMISTQCNFHCRHCMVNSSHDYNFMDDNVLEKCYHLIETNNPDWVYLIGGEPFLHIEKIELIVRNIKKYCTNILIFTNGSFLMNDKLKKRVDALDVSIRISNDRFHREMWSKELEKRIFSSGYRIETVADEEDMIPVGRAFEEFKHLQYNMGCSLISGRCGRSYPNGHRYMVMMNGDVNLYCSTIEAALANVFEDENITYELLVKRERILHNYLYQHIIRCEEDTYMAKMCNECPKYKVNNLYILYESKILAECADYE